MRRIRVGIAVFVSLFLIAACAGSKMSVIQLSKIPSRGISRIAIAPGSGVLGEAISIELFNRGLTIIDSNEATTILARAGLKEFEITSSQGFAALRERGTDALLVAKSVAAADGTPESAVVRVTDTSDGQVIAAITWQNGFWGMRGSMKAVFLFLFSRHRFQDLAVELSKTQPEGTKWDFPKTPASRIRRALYNSLLVVLGAIAAGWLTGVVCLRSFGPASGTLLQILQYVGIATLLWATLAKGGWNIQTIKGESLPEKVDQWIYRSLYFVGSYFLVVSVSWAAR